MPFSEGEIDLRERQKSFYDLLESAMKLASQGIPEDMIWNSTPYAEYKEGFIYYGYRSNTFEPDSMDPDEDDPDAGQTFVGRIPVPPELRKVAEETD